MMMEWYVDFDATLPCAEEIREECETMEASSGVGAHLRRYCGSNRMELTWGWFLEKTALYWERKAEPWISMAENLILAKIDSVWRKHLDGIKDGLEKGARQFLEILLLQDPGNSRDKELLGSLYRHCPTLWNILAEIPETGKQLLRIQQNTGARVGWLTIKNWLEYRKKRAEEKTVTKEFLVNLFRLAETYVVNLRYEHMKFLEEYTACDEDFRRLFAEHLAWKFYRCLWHKYVYEKQEREHTDDYARMCQRMTDRGENFFAIFYRRNILTEPQLQEKILTEMLELFGKRAEIDLMDLDEYLFLHQGFYGEEAVRWAVKNLHITNRTNGEFFRVQMELVNIASEEELTFIRKRGAFPRDTMRRLVHEVRMGGEITKLPLLIQWMYEGE